MSFPRYPTYKPSGVEWLGEVPEHWEVLPLKRRSRLLTEKTECRDNPIALENIEGWTGRLVETDSEFLGEGVAFEPGDILFGKLRPYLAKVYLAAKGGQAVGDFHVIHPFDSLHPRFLQFLLLTKEMIDLVNGSTFGAKMPRASWDFLASLHLSIPPLDEQSVIATFLDHETAKIDALIAEQQRLIELLQEKRQAVISHAVTKGLNPDAPMKNSGVEWLGEVPEHWEKSRLRALFRQEKRQDQPTSPVLSVYRDYGVILKDSRDDNHNKTPESLSAYQLVNRDDLVVNKMKAWQGSLGVSVLHGITSPDYAVFTPHHNEFSLYLHFLLRSCRMTSVYRSISNGIRPAQWRIEPGVFLDLPVFLPPTHEQELIAGHVSRESEKFDQLVKESESFVNLLQERRSALISAAVTGQIDVRGLVPEAGAA